MAGKRPDAEVSDNFEVSELEEDFASEIASKQSIALVFNVIMLIVLLVRVDLDIGEVNNKVKVVFLLQEVSAYLLRRRTRTRRISLIFACRGLDDVLVDVG